MRLRDLGAGLFGRKWSRGKERGEAIRRGQTTEGLVSQTKESELYLAAQEQPGRDLSRAGAGSDLCFMGNTMEAKRKMV